MNKSESPKRNIKNNCLIDKILSIIIIFVIILIIISILYVASNPIAKEGFSEFYLLDSKKNIKSFPNLLNVGENADVIIGISNHEYQTIDYTVEIWLINQSLDYNELLGKNETSYNNAWFIDKISVRLEHTEIDTEKTWDAQWEKKYSFNITKEEGKYKLLFLLYKSSTSNYDYEKDYKDIIEEKIDSSYNNLGLWITII